MSIEEWKKEFYPVDVPELMAQDPSDIELIEHSLRKWRGLRDAELRRFPTLSKVKGFLREEVEIKDLADHKSVVLKEVFEVFKVASETCALCARYLDDNCGSCPLQDERGGQPCDEPVVGESRDPYQAFVRFGNPEPMIELLEAALATAKKKGGQI